MTKRPDNKGGFAFGLIATAAMAAILVFAFVNGDFDESGRVGPFVVTLPIGFACAVLVTVHSWFKVKEK